MGVWVSGSMGVGRAALTPTSTWARGKGSTSRGRGGTLFGTRLPARPAPLLLSLGFLLIGEPVKRPGFRAVREENTIQVIDLVLKHPRQQIFGADPDALAAAVETGHLHHLRAPNVALQARDAKAALGANLFPGAIHNLRIDKSARPSLL